MYLIFPRYKIIKERNNKTDTDRHSWKYYDLFDEMFHGDSAVRPISDVFGHYYS